MEQEIQDVSIKRIQEAMPQLKGIENELIIDYTEHKMPNDKHPIHRYPIRFDGLYIGLREKGKARFSINLKEFEVGHNDLVICSPDDLVQATLQEDVHLVQSMVVSSHFLKEMYISLNSFMPFFAARKDHPVFHLTDSEMEELKAYFLLINDNIEKDVAILQLETKKLPNENCNIVDLSQAVVQDSEIHVGSHIYTMGFPFGLSLQDLKSSKGIQLFGQGSSITRECSEYSFSFNAPSYHGASGSPIFNERGQLIGVLNSGVDKSQGFNYAIKASHVIELLNNNIPQSNN